MAGQPLIKQVTKGNVRPGGRVVPHLLAQLVTDHDRRVLRVSRTAEHELLTGHRVDPAETQTWYVPPRWRMPVRSFGAGFLRAISAAYSAIMDTLMDKDPPWRSSSIYYLW